MQKSNKSSAAMKLGLAAVASLALTFGAAMPAFAANVQVGPSDVAPFEIGNEALSTWNYDQWHIGSERDGTRDTLAESLAFGECSVTLGETSGQIADWVQVMKGFPLDGRPTGALGGDISQIRALVDSASIEVLTKSVTIQVPVFIHFPGDDQPLFTTFLSAPLEPGVHKLADQPLMSSNNFETQFSSDELFGLLAEAPFPGMTIEILGVGFNGDKDSSVASLSFSGDTYFFGTGSCLPAAATPPVKIETAA